MGQKLEIFGPDGKKEAEINTDDLAQVDPKHFEAIMDAQKRYGRTFKLDGQEVFDGRIQDSMRKLRNRKRSRRLHQNAN